MVGTTRFELATSPTPILETTQSEQLSKIYQYVRERETTQRNAYWTRNGPIDGPTLAHAIDNAARTATGDEFAFYMTRMREGQLPRSIWDHSVVQVVTEHIKPEYAHPDFSGVNPKPHDWDKKLIETWPKVSTKILWPPRSPFTNGGPEGIAYLMDRWRMGAPVTPGSI